VEGLAFQAPCQTEGPLRQLLRNFHLPQPLPQAGGETQMGRVQINPDQYFENVPAIAWEFHIGGYQPAQKWLKDRKGRALSFDDVVYYQKIIKILSETDRILREIILPFP
jgi:hypothetical protein